MLGIRRKILIMVLRQYSQKQEEPKELQSIHGLMTAHGETWTFRMTGL
jgi:hypothetical protein